MTFDDTMKTLFEKLGEAIYIHKEHIKMAKDASDAVDYMAEQGVFDEIAEQK